MVPTDRPIYFWNATPENSIAKRMNEPANLRPLLSKALPAERSWPCGKSTCSSLINGKVLCTWGVFAFLLFRSLAMEAQVTMVWAHRFPDPGQFTGFGDVGTGLDLRPDSLLVGRTFGNHSATSLLHASNGQTRWENLGADTVVMQGGIAFQQGNVLRADRVVRGTGLHLAAAQSTTGGVPLGLYTDEGLDVARMRGPLRGPDGRAWSLAYGTADGATAMHAHVYDGALPPLQWSHATGLPWTDLHGVPDLTGGLVLAAMVDHPSAFSDVPLLLRFDASSGDLLWERYLTDTTGFLVDAAAHVATWGSDTLLTVFTTWDGTVELRMNDPVTGDELWRLSDTLPLTPLLSTLVADVAAGIIHVGTDNGLVVTYDRHGRLWMDSLPVQAQYPGSFLGADGNRLVEVLAKDPGLGEGQDVLIRELDRWTGLPGDQALWNDTIADTHDLLQAALLSHDTLYLLTASTYDTLSILTERTTLTATAWHIGGTAGVAAAAEKEAPTAWPVPTDGLLHVQGAPGWWVEVRDALGRTWMSVPWSSPLDVGRLAVGSYVLRLSKSDGQPLRPIKFQRQ